MGSQRRQTADLLERLSDAEWRHASLCDGWTVRDVAAHLTLQQLGLGDALRTMLRHPGGMNHAIRESAREKAARPVGELIAEIRATVGSRRHNVGVTPRETLIDILVHSQDIALPLHHELPLPPDAAAEAASRVWASLGRPTAGVFHRIPWRGHRFTATDTAWTVGDGPEVSGPIGALLLLLTGRRAALQHLTGDGLASLSA